MGSRGVNESAPHEGNDAGTTVANMEMVVEVMAEQGDSVAVADVYAGDAGAQCRDEGVGTLFLFVIDADPEPDVLARVAIIFNIANVAPRRVEFQRKSEGNVAMTVAIPLVGGVQADMIRRKLEQLTCVLSVSLTEVS